MGPAPRRMWTAPLSSVDTGVDHPPTRSVVPKGLTLRGSPRVDSPTPPVSEGLGGRVTGEPGTVHSPSGLYLGLRLDGRDLDGKTGFLRRPPVTVRLRSSRERSSPTGTHRKGPSSPGPVPRESYLSVDLPFPVPRRVRPRREGVTSTSDPPREAVRCGPTCPVLSRSPPAGEVVFWGGVTGRDTSPVPEIERETHGPRVDDRGGGWVESRVSRGVP